MVKLSVIIAALALGGCTTTGSVGINGAATVVCVNKEHIKAGLHIYTDTHPEASTNWMVAVEAAIDSVCDLLFSKAE